jgi:pimeloyl-ACP methyl ester carboxylesterase
LLSLQGCFALHLPKHQLYTYLVAIAEGPPVLLIHGYGASAYHWRYQFPFFARAEDEFVLLLLQGPPVLLIHGYGASAYHWRYQIPALAQNYRVFALDLLGFGWSEKALVEYSSGGLWGQQIVDFIRDVVHAGDSATTTSSSSSAGSEPVVLVGNSLGGYACLNAAAKSPELIR